ncbi:MAG: Asp23/Gls24 family envelope stress response protein [Actinomycetota bacterium]|nr:Asp23/Gls24 family envelope stress response protein [Actinomycetota bacterium]
MTVTEAERPGEGSSVDRSAAAGLRTDRGITTIAPAVVEKIAGRAATEIEGVGVVAPAGLRRLFSSTPDADTPPDADARVGMERASVALTISIRYPAPVRRTSTQVRAAVAEKVEQFTGLHVSWVDVTVAQLPTNDPFKSRRRVE